MDAAFLGFIASIGLGISLVKYSVLRKYFYISLFFTPTINLGSYFWASYLNGSFMKPNNFIGFLFKKIETGYFGAVAGSVAAGNLIYLLINKVDKRKVFNIIWWILGLILVLLSALVSNTKNGVAIAVSICTFLALILIINALLNTRGSKTLLLGVFILITLIVGAVWHEHQSLATFGWSTVFEDAKAGLEIDKNLQWQKKRELFRCH